MEQTARHCVDQKFCYCSLGGRTTLLGQCATCQACRLCHTFLVFACMMSLLSCNEQCQITSGNTRCFFVSWPIARFLMWRTIASFVLTIQYQHHLFHIYESISSWDWWLSFGPSKSQIEMLLKLSLLFIETNVLPLSHADMWKRSNVVMMCFLCCSGDRTWCVGIVQESVRCTAVLFTAV